MNKIAVLYWSGTGNTEAMAQSVTEGAKAAGAEVILASADEAAAASFADYDKYAFGCPAMGDEIIEDTVFEPFYEALVPSFAGKPVVLFGSYGWGDGQWMRDWKVRAEKDGAVLCTEPLIVNEAPDADGLAQCSALGKALAEA